MQDNQWQLANFNDEAQKADHCFFLCLLDDLIWD